MGTITHCRLSILYVTGYKVDGNPIFKLKQFRNILPQAADENLYQTALAIAALQQHDVQKVERNNTYELAE